MPALRYMAVYRNTCPQRTGTRPSPRPARLARGPAPAPSPCRNRAPPRPPRRPPWPARVEHHAPWREGAGAARPPPRGPAPRWSCTWPPAPSRPPAAPAPRRCRCRLPPRSPAAPPPPPTRPGPAAWRRGGGADARGVREIGGRTRAYRRQGCKRAWPHASDSSLKTNPTVGYSGKSTRRRSQTDPNSGFAAGVVDLRVLSLCSP